MGITRKQRKKVLFHKKRWDKATIEEEKVIVKDYAMKNKKEIRKFELLLKNIKSRAKELNRECREGLTKEAQEFISRLQHKGFLKVKDAGLDDVLGITLRDILDRRLGSLVYKKKLARTPKQARQLISHGHIAVNGQCSTSPNQLIPVDLENTIDYYIKSPLSNEDHPLRKEELEEIEMEKKEIEESPLRAPQEEAEDYDEKEERLNEEEVKEVEE